MRVRFWFAVSVVLNAIARPFMWFALATSHVVVHEPVTLTAPPYSGMRFVFRLRHPMVRALGWPAWLLATSLQMLAGNAAARCLIADGRSLEGPL